MITLSIMFALLWIAPLAQCQTGQLPSPANVSLSWVTDFCYKLSWTPPVENQNCIYEVEVNSDETDAADKLYLADTVQYQYDVMQGSLLEIKLSALCGEPKVRSAAVSRSLHFRELVKDFMCALHSRTSLNCTWQPAPQVADFHLYYWVGAVFEKTSSKPKDGCSTTFDLVECPAYKTDANGSRTGCALRHDRRHDRRHDLRFIDSYIWFLFNGTVDGTLARNTFKVYPSKHMQPPALTWTGEVDYDNKLTIRWTPVDLEVAWDYILDYTKCGKRETMNMSSGTNHTVLMLGHCAFNITMKAKHEHGESLPGPYRVYGKNTNPHTVLILACTLIPAAVVIIVVVAFYCFRRHNESIFPQVPAPQDFLLDMLKNNNDKEMYVPAPEEEPQNVRFDIEPESRSDKSS